MSRGLGYLPDAPDVRDWAFEARKIPDAPDARVCASAPDLRAYRGDRLEQGGAGACVGFALARAIYMRNQIIGRTSFPLPSPMWLYHAARRQEFAGQDPNTLPPLTDVGCYPRLAMQGARNVGFCAWDAWQYDPALVNEAPPVGAVVGAYDARGLEYFRISQNPFDAIRESLSIGLPVIFGMQVDRPFMHHRGEQAITQIDPAQIVGGHMMAILAVEGNDVIIDNWWGDDWGFGDGFARIDGDLLSSGFVGDIYAVGGLRP